MLTARESKELRALQRRRIREREGRFVAEGVRVVEDLLASPLEVIWAVASSSLGDTERGRSLLALLAARGIPLRELSEESFARVAATEHPQGVLAVAGVPRWTLEDLPGAFVPAVLLVLDAVQDPGNLGTLVRSAEGLGAAGVIALPGTVDPWNPKAIRSAVGSSFRLPIVAAAWPEAEAFLRAGEYPILGAEVGGGGVPRGISRAALLVGNEGAGLGPELLRAVDATVGIPLRGRAESLNVAVAASILLYELTR